MDEASLKVGQSWFIRVDWIKEWRRSSLYVQRLTSSDT